MYGVLLATVYTNNHNKIHYQTIFNGITEVLIVDKTAVPTKQLCWNDEVRR